VAHADSPAALGAGGGGRSRQRRAAPSAGEGPRLPASRTEWSQVLALERDALVLGLLRTRDGTLAYAHALEAALAARPRPALTAADLEAAAVQLRRAGDGLRALHIRAVGCCGGCGPAPR